MTRVMFVCHGNICRSTMAEFVLKHLVAQRGCADAFAIASSGTSREEIGMDTHAGTRRKLKSVGIATPLRRAVQLTAADYEKYDHFFAMDSANASNMRRILGGDPAGKVRRLLDLTQQPRDIADPWYTGDFDATFEDVAAGCEAFLSSLHK